MENAMQLLGSDEEIKERDLLLDTLIGYFTPGDMREVLPRFSELTDLIFEFRDRMMKIVSTEGPLTRVWTHNSGIEEIQYTEKGKSWSWMLRASQAWTRREIYYDVGPMMQAFLNIRDNVPGLLEGAKKYLYGMTPQFAGILEYSFRKFSIVIRRREFAIELETRNRYSARNYRSITKYIDTLFGIYRRLLIVRLDLAYRNYNAPFDYNGIGCSLSRIQADRARFINNMDQNSLFSGLVGWTMKLEYGLRRGYHIHAFFFFNGDERRGDIYIGRRIGDYWLRITHQNGTVHLCNMHPERYKSSRDPSVGNALGLVERNDAMRRVYLNRAIAYLTKPDKYVRVALPKGHRIFFRGEIPKSKRSLVRAKKPQKFCFTRRLPGASNVQQST